MSWAVSYDLPGIKRAADAVVVGTISGIASTYLRRAHVLDTDYTFEVDTVIWNPQQQLQSTQILIHHPGGIRGEIRSEAVGIPLFEVGERAILFLKHYEADEAHHFTAFGGYPDARFPVRDGLIYRMRDSLITLPTPLTEQEFIKLIQDA